ncbi:MAG TPA: OmpA family protein [Bacteroidia bacterium]|jgi:chemotaxis protein MotB|nr:OmpA family protein [Bacteroidia bacterium]
MKSILVKSGILLMFLNSCAPHVDCGLSGKPPKVMSKRYRAALTERDTLCNQLNRKKAELVEQKAKYDELKSASGNTVAMLSSDLDKKQKELNEKENALKEREKSMQNLSARLRDMESIIRRQDSIMSRLTGTVKDALLGFNPDELTVTMHDGKVYVSMSDKLLFKSGSADVESKGKTALEKLANVLNKNPDVAIAVEGHTDNVPIKTSQYADNWDLSAARATNVVRLLTTSYKMDPRRLTASGRGEFFPVADNSTPEGKAKNRRTEIVLSPKLDELMKVISK